MSSKQNSVQTLPSLITLMRTAMRPGSDKIKSADEHDHENQSFESPPVIIEPAHIDSAPSIMGYQHVQGRLSMPIPNQMTPSHLQLSESSGYSMPMDTDSHGFSLPSPVSPRTRCPSLSESMLSAGSPPSDHGPATPVPEHGNIVSGLTTLCNDRGSMSSNVYRESHHYNHHHPNRVTKPYRGTSSRPSIRIGSPSPPPSRLASHQGASDSSEPRDGKLSKHEKRRLNHLNSEKKRRESIKGGMDALFDLVPSCRDFNESKANILKKAKDYILELHGVIRECQDELKYIHQENGELRRLLGNGQDSYTSSSRFVCRL